MFQPNESQKRAVLHKDGPMLVLAGPGSGKTAVITERTKYLITECGVNPSNILVITFTKAAANEMKQRFEKLMHKTSNVTFGTFHAIFFMVLKLAYGFTASNIVKDEQKYQAMREIISQFSLDYRDENEFLSNLFGEISTIKNSRISLENFYSAQCGADIFRKIYQKYNNFLNRNRLIDFDDMLTMTYELFRERKDILSAWQKKYSYILVDEFQDINQIQYEIVRMLAFPNNNLFMVGDDDQSIYRFRGSKPEIMMRIPKDYPNLTQIELDTNYRCKKSIVDASLRLIAHNSNRFEKKVTAHKKGENAVSYLTFENQREEILFIIKTISEQLQKGYLLSDIAILFRTNIQPRLLMEQFMSYNVDFKMRDQIPNLYEHWIAKDIFTYINIARGSRERKDFFQILNKPKRYLSRDSLYNEYVLFEEWETLYEEQPWIAERIQKLEADIQMLSKMSPYAAINYIRHGIGYDDYIQEYAGYRNINQEDLFDVLEELQASAKGFRNYEAWELHIKECGEELKEKARLKNENPNAITLATLHSAKGLEFKLVFLIDVNEGIMPYKKAVLEQDIEEERRLFYVGMTRAIEQLTICSLKNIHNKTAEISRFVLEAQGKEF